MMSPWLLNIFTDGVGKEMNANVLGNVAGLKYIESHIKGNYRICSFSDEAVLLADKSGKACKRRNSK